MHLSSRFWSVKIGKSSHLRILWPFNQILANYFFGPGARPLIFKNDQGFRMNPISDTLFLDEPEMQRDGA